MCWPNSLDRRPPWLYASSVKNKKQIFDIQHQFWHSTLCPKRYEPDINKSYFSSFRFGNFGNCQVPRQCLLGQSYPRESLGSLWWQECRNLRIYFVEVQVLRPLWWPQWWEHCWPQDPRKVFLCIIMKTITAEEGFKYTLQWNGVLLFTAMCDFNQKWLLCCT